MLTERRAEFVRLYWPDGSFPGLGPRPRAPRPCGPRPRAPGPDKATDRASGGKRGGECEVGRPEGVVAGGVRPADVPLAGGPALNAAGDRPGRSLRGSATAVVAAAVTARVAATTARNRRGCHCVRRLRAPRFGARRP